MTGGCRRQLLALAAGAALVALGAAAPSPASAERYVVTTTKDRAGACTKQRCALRAAILAANASPQDDVIRVPAGVYRLSRDGAGEDAGLTGDLDVDEAGGRLQILGAGAARTVIDGGGIDRVLHLPFGNPLVDAPVTLAGLAIRGGRASQDGGGLRVDGERHAILRAVRVVANRTGGSADGGGVENRGRLVVRRSTVANNRAGGDGGGLSMNASGEIFVDSSTISGNGSPDTTSGHDGGGIYVTGGSLTVVNSTISGNQARGPSADGGAIYKTGAATVALTHATLARNFADSSGGGLYATGGGSVLLGHSLLARNSDPGGRSNCAGPVAAVSNGRNLEDHGTCGLGGAGDRSHAAAKIAPLRANGGPTRTHALRRASPAVNIVPAAACDLKRDQRGVKRPQRGRRCDAGAFELV